MFVAIQIVLAEYQTRHEASESHLHVRNQIDANACKYEYDGITGKRSEED